MKKTGIMICAAVIALAFIIFTDYTAEALDMDKPANISVTFTSDTMTEKSFTWTTKNLAPTQAVVVVRETEGGPEREFTGSTEIVTGRYDFYYDQDLFNDPYNVISFKVNKVTATGLKPGTRYTYYCGDGTAGNWSETYTFETGAETGSFTFLHLTDPQAMTTSEFQAWQNCSERAYAAFPDAKFFALTGDMVERGSSQNQWDNFFGYGSRILSNLTVAPAIGNHEASYEPHLLDKRFNLPGNDRGLPDYVYSFDYGNARFIVMSTEITYAQLNSGDERIREEAVRFVDEQVSWLRETVSNDPKKWNIVMFHKPVYTGGLYEYSYESLYYREKFAPVFDELSIDAVLQGHNHTYDRGFIYGGKTAPGVTPDTVATVKNKGTVYLTGNSSGMKFYDAAADNPRYLLRNIQPFTQFYTGITVAENYMRFKVYAVTPRENDRLYDVFTIYKY